MLAQDASSAPTGDIEWLHHARAVVHPLLFCPPIPKNARYCLVSRNRSGARKILGTGKALNSHPPLNLAIIRQRGAKLCANEVYVIPPLPAVLTSIHAH